jgi:hypothetical protein
MGLFALPLYDDPKKNAKAAIANLELYTTEEGGLWNLQAAFMCVQKAIEQEKEKTNE